MVVEMKQHRLIARLADREPSVSFIFKIDFKDKEVSVTAAKVTSLCSDRYKNTITQYTAYLGWVFTMPYKDFLVWSEAGVCKRVLSDFRKYRKEKDKGLGGIHA